MHYCFIYIIDKEHIELWVEMQSFFPFFFSWNLLETFTMTQISHYLWFFTYKNTLSIRIIRQNILFYYFCIQKSDTMRNIWIFGGEFLLCDYIYWHNVILYEMLYFSSRLKPCNFVFWTIFVYILLIRSILNYELKCNHFFPSFFLETCWKHSQWHRSVIICGSLHIKIHSVYE